MMLKEFILRGTMSLDVKPSLGSLFPLLHKTPSSFPFEEELEIKGDVKEIMLRKKICQECYRYITSLVDG